MTALDPFPLLAAIAVSAVTCAGVIRSIMPLLVHYALARPNARSSHIVPTPQGAGVAVIVATLLVAAAIGYAVPAATVPAALFGATLLIALVGAIDDIRPLPVMARLLLQAIAVGAVVFVLPAENRIVATSPIWIERLLLLIAGVWFVNLVNFMDGLDWMTVAEVVPITSVLVMFSLGGALPASPTLVAAALGGAMLGFAPFNRPVAKLFLGDVGSLPIGLLLGWCLLELALAHHPAAALLLPLYYLADTAVTLLRRIGNREAFWRAHRSHFYQRATDKGFSVNGVVGRVFALNLLLGLLAGVTVAFASVAVDILALVAGVTLVTLLLVHFSRPRRPPAR